MVTHTVASQAVQNHRNGVPNEEHTNWAIQLISLFIVSDLCRERGRGHGDQEARLSCEGVAILMIYTDLVACFCGMWTRRAPVDLIIPNRQCLARVEPVRFSANYTIRRSPTASISDFKSSEVFCHLWCTYTYSTRIWEVYNIWSIPFLFNIDFLILKHMNYYRSGCVESVT